MNKSNPKNTLELRKICKHYDFPIIIDEFGRLIIYCCSNCGKELNRT